MHKSMCLLCYQEYPYDSLNLLTTTEESLKVENQILECTQVVLNFHDLIPYALCNNCLVELNVAYAFRNKCVTAVSKLIKTKETLYEFDQIKDYKIKCSVKCYHDYVPKEINQEDYQKTEHKTESADESRNDYLVNSIRHKSCATTSLVRNSKYYTPKTTKKGLKTKIRQDYQCSLCLYNTHRKQTLVNHLRTHSGERPYKCDCGKSFAQQSAYLAHKASHSNIRKYVCSVCAKEFKLKYALKRHLNCHSEGTYSCNICAKKLKSRETLDIHLDRHARIQRYHCEVCGEKFFSSSELWYHRNKHNEQVYLECDVCNYKTTTKKVLIVHLKRHSGVKIFQCALCPYSFYTSGELRVHNRVHTREKRYPCLVCNQNFMHSNTLNRHVRVIHGKI